MRRLPSQTVQRFRRRVRELTRRTRGVSHVRMVQDLARYLRGWLSYIGRRETPSTLASLEQWTRRRLRTAIWKQWKRGRRRYAELRRRGVGVLLAARTAGSAHGPWRLANSPALSFALPNAYFAELGLPNLRVRQWSNRSDRRIRTRTYGSVGGVEPQGFPLSRFARLLCRA